MKISFKKASILLILGLLCILGAEWATKLIEQDTNTIQKAEVFAKELDRKTNLASDLIEEIRVNIRREGIAKTQLAYNDLFGELFYNEGIIINIFRNDILSLWSHNTVSPTSLLRVASRGTEIHLFDNGWYKLVYLTDGVDEYVAAILIKRKFPYENQFLDNRFQKDFRLRALTEISTKPTEGAVKLLSGRQPFYLHFETEVTNSLLKPLLYISLSLIGGILVLWAIISIALRLKTKGPAWPVFLCLILAILSLRYLSIISGWPNFLMPFGLFNPAVYASSQIFPSLIDFGINAILLFIIALSARYSFIKTSEAQNKTLAQFGLIILLGCVFAFSVWINYLCKGLVLNSNIPFDINNIIGLNVYSFIGILIAGLLYVSFFLFAERITIYAFRKSIHPNILLLQLSIVTLCHVLVTHSLGIRDLIFVLWPVVAFLLIFIQVYYRGRLGPRLGELIPAVVIFAVVASHNFIKYSENREESQRFILAEKLSVDNDPVAELLYNDLIKELVRDKNVRGVFEENELHTRETLEDYVLSRYFTGYWGKYNIEMYAYLGDSTVWGKLPSVRPLTFKEIQREIDQYGEPSALNEGLYYMYNSADLTTYIAILPLHYSLDVKPDGFFVFYLGSKLFPQQLGFPSLLIDKTSQVSDESNVYASARYVGGRLVNSRGDYPYRSHPGIFENVVEGSQTIAKRGYEHLVTRVDDHTLVVISKEMGSPLDRATTFSYLCVIFGFALSLGLLAKYVLLGKNPFELNLNQKIQALLVVLTVTSLFLFALATTYFIQEKYTDKNRRQISEKMQSILLEIKSKLGEEESLNYDMSDMLNRMLSQFAYIFFTDINLYAPDGSLLASSQMRMYNEGLVSRRIHPEAYAFVNYLDQIEYIHEERIGNMAYLSGYTPFYNDRGDLLGYINLPYFAKQTELENEISNFLVSVINLFVLLFLLSILLGLFMSQLITSPLSAIRRSLAGIELGKTNRIMAYSGSDEIGRLVQEYNLKVSELEHNAEKLAQSERESAWREMAKQVAHEIKNPLTPMKLSVQHLQRSIDIHGEVDPDQVKRLAENLVEQIDALSGIANAFSNFARMPQAKEEVLDLKKLLQNAVELYESFENVSFHSTIGNSDPVLVNADKEHLLRVFNNLIKNAVQSLMGESKGFVQIKLFEQDYGYVVEVVDNGSGIPEEAKEKIFVPNFTTKSRGMGLGLAMAKNIVENSGGKISFTSEADKGSIFRVWLPKA